MNGCVYRTKDDKCEFWSDHGKGIVSYCDFDDCEEKRPSNADRIRSMTDEELACIMGPYECVGCPAETESGECMQEGENCYKALLRWLKAPVEECE